MEVPTHLQIKFSYQTNHPVCINEIRSEYHNLNIFSIDYMFISKTGRENINVVVFTFQLKYLINTLTKNTFAFKVKFIQTANKIV